MADYTGTFGIPQAERLLWRAGFGPKPGEAAQFAALGLQGAVAALFPTKKASLKGKAPKDDRGRSLAPKDAYGHDHLWWLDRMIRTSKPIEERMTLIWHDWFATSNDGVGSQKLMLAQNDTLRKNALGSFWGLLNAVTIDPAMLIWLSGLHSEPPEPNENYGRELMELFTLGAGTGSYTEDDVREQARALTGWTATWKPSGYTKFRFDPERHDDGQKGVFNYAPFNVAPGNWDYEDSVRLCIQHPNHPDFFVKKLWSYFVPTPPDTTTLNALKSTYVTGNYQVTPLLQTIFKHQDFYEGPSMVKPPVVYTAGVLRALNRTIDTTYWVWLDGRSGQQLFYPPNVAGWNDNRWLDTSSYRGRWDIAYVALEKTALEPWSNKVTLPLDAGQILDQALQSIGSPTLETGARDLLVDFGAQALADGALSDDQQGYARQAYNAMRQLLLTMPEAQTC